MKLAHNQLPVTTFSTLETPPAISEALQELIDEQVNHFGQHVFATVRGPMLEVFCFASGPNKQVSNCVTVWIADQSPEALNKAVKDILSLKGW